MPDVPTPQEINALPEPIRDIVRAKLQLWTTNRCPCGSEMTFRNPTYVLIRHADDCKFSDQAIDRTIEETGFDVWALLRRWELDAF